MGKDNQGAEEIDHRPSGSAVVAGTEDDKKTFKTECHPLAQSHIESHAESHAALASNDTLVPFDFARRSSGYAG